jgi:ABC-type transporter lipoprotein component MlaA
MTALYRADTTLLTVLRVECPDGTKYPAADADGTTIYDNMTHFPTEAEAWERLMREVEAGVSLAGSRVLEVRSRLQDANQYAADQAVEYATVRDRYRDWRRAQEQSIEPLDEECDE